MLVAMPRRPLKSKSICVSPKPLAENQTEPTGSSPPQDLSGWIRQLESETITVVTRGGKPPTGAQRILQSLRRSAESFDLWCWSPVDRQRIADIVGDMPTEITFHEALKDRLLVIWADNELWKLIHTGQQHSPPAPHPIDDCVQAWLLNKYHLSISFCASVWFEMVRQTVDRAYLFQLMVFLAPRFFWVQSHDPAKGLEAKWRGELSPNKLGALLHNYVQNPVQDWRHVLVFEKYPQEVLRSLRAALIKFADDTGYTIKHPGRFDARRAPPVAHRVRTLQDVHHIEQMVAKLRQNPSITDYSLAKQCLGSMAGNGRKLAHEARLLAYYREQIPVTFHPSKGKKPKGR